MPPTPSSTFGHGDTEAIWDEVSAALERFLAAWEEDRQGPCLADFLPDSESAARNAALIELIKVDMEQRREQGITCRGIREYAGEFPDLVHDGQFPPDLLYEEFHLRKSGESLTVGQFADEYPTQRAAVVKMLGGEDPFVSTSMVHRRRPVELSPGDIVSDFELLRELGRGAFASVFLARQKSMQRLVAVKLSSDHGREPQTLARLDHPHIVRVYDQRTDDDRSIHVLYMEYLPAGTLQNVVERMGGLDPASWNGESYLAAVDDVLEEQGVHPPLDSQWRQRLGTCQWWEVVCLLGSHLADALHHAHQQGVLHRDIKPANILITDVGAPKLADFNVSSCTTVAGATPEAYFGGSLAYMSPEQMEACNPGEPRGAGRSGCTNRYLFLGNCRLGIAHRHTPIHCSQHDRHSLKRS